MEEECVNIVMDSVDRTYNMQIEPCELEISAVSNLQLQLHCPEDPTNGEVFLVLEGLGPGHDNNQAHSETHSVTKLSFEGLSV